VTLTMTLILPALGYPVTLRRHRCLSLRRAYEFKNNIS